MADLDIIVIIILYFLRTDPSESIEETIQDYRKMGGGTEKKK